MTCQIDSAFQNICSLVIRALYLYREKYFLCIPTRVEYLASLQTAQGRAPWRYLLIPEGSTLHILC